MHWLTKLIFITACFSGATSFAETQDYAQVLNSYLNQKLILGSLGESKNVSIKAGDLKYAAGRCDVAVEVLDVRNEKTKIVFRLEQIGHIRTGGKSKCFNVWKETELTITDLGDITPPNLASGLQEVFFTPEAYLARNSHPTSPDQSRLNSPTKPPKVILEITPTLTDKKRTDSNRAAMSRVAVRATVGTDGKIHSPSIMYDPGLGLGEQSLRVLPLWRFEPGYQDNKAVDVTTVLELSFAAY